MYLTGHRLDLLTRVMTTLVEPHEEHEIRIRVGALMLDLLGAQHYASYVWDHERERFDGGVRINMDGSNLARYEQHYQFHDPITKTMQRHRQAVLVTDVMPQEQLIRTEFFTDFLARDGLYWGVNLYAWEGDRNIGDMRIWRDRNQPNFSDEDLGLLNLVRPAFVAALTRARDARATRTAPAPLQLQASEPSARRALSAREFEVALEVTNGASDKEIARRLGISVTTVRTHIDHAFGKLHVNSRVALTQKFRR
jgi:DNA-binding CsgD family transcriptional regulator